ncbi:hypothetical protein [Sulfuricurvum sp.]|uniref:hypothetical protein n=1 Tax=Sulfuricurvum sp. TaxID=2025608 RepID=UPI0026362E82|nr:hypothetical protein [Sulfuricurvum sp.]MDD4884703.1 hypothetical protein [Sulfuricurvum sp.]
MDENLVAIERFIGKHHLLTLATYGERLWCCSMFYAYDAENIALIVASDPQTQHMQNVVLNTEVAGTIALETKIVGKIEGIQFRAQMTLSEERKETTLYMKHFPYALAMNPTLWSIRLSEIKLTDNTLGFGKKLSWKRPL